MREDIRLGVAAAAVTKATSVTARRLSFMVAVFQE